jgi:hypothetical protein
MLVRGRRSLELGLDRTDAERHGVVARSLSSPAGAHPEAAFGTIVAIDQQPGATRAVLVGGVDVPVAVVVDLVEAVFCGW